MEKNKINRIDGIKLNINLEKLLCLYIVLLPILDIASFLFRKFFNTAISPVTFIRPIIPIFVFLIIFFKNNFKIKSIIIAIIYISYTIIHLIIFKHLHYRISDDSMIHELQYLINYSFAILTLFDFLFVFYKKDLTELKKSIIIALFIYIFSIYLSIITNTYTYTYIEEGAGIKGWFESGNSLSSILMLGLFLLYSMFTKENNNKIIILTITLIGIYLLFLIGTRVGFFGFILINMLAVFIRIICDKRNRISISKKNWGLVLSFAVILIIITLIFGSYTFKRRKYLLTVNSNIIDENTNENIHVSISVLEVINKIKSNSFEPDYASNAQISALYKLYDIANYYKINSTSRRFQEFIYNLYLVKYQNNILSLIFGNGLLNNFCELVLEMELPAFILNFGILGFCLFFLPFAYLFIYNFNIFIKNIKKADFEYVMLIFGNMFVFALSLFTGVTFFSVSSSTMVICINILLLNKSISVTGNGEKNK